MSVVFCPRCGLRVADLEEPVPPKHFPFCSERCTWIDLGKWFEEEHRLADPSTPPASTDEDAFET